MCIIESEVKKVWLSSDVALQDGCEVVHFNREAPPGDYLLAVAPESLEMERRRKQKK